MIMPLFGTPSHLLEARKAPSHSADPRTSHDSYAVRRDGACDDLLLATALACWWGERSCPPAQMLRLRL